MTGHKIFLPIFHIVRYRCEEPSKFVAQSRITDDRNRLLDFNGLNLQLAIQFDFVYSKKAIEPLTNIESRLIRHTDDRNLLKDNKQELKKVKKKKKKY